MKSNRLNHNGELPTRPPGSRLSAGTGIGMLLGLLLGIGLDNIALGIVLGSAFGVALGAAMEARTLDQAAGAARPDGIMQLLLTLGLVGLAIVALMILLMTAD